MLADANLYAMRVTCAISICLLLAVAGCPHKTSKDFHGKDRQMVDAAIAIRNAIGAFRGDTADFPLTIREAERYLPAGTEWPVNPYNGKPIVDNGSAEFDAATSIGTVFYETFTRQEQVVGFRLHVFGDKGRLAILDHTAFGAQ